MAQAALPFEPVSGEPFIPTPTAWSRLSESANAPADPVAHAIGWDFARHRLTPPVAHLQAESPVLQGWQAGRRVLRSHTRSANAAVKRWLSLRLQAWLDGTAFEDVQVTPAYLRRLGASLCPVTRAPLSSDPVHPAVEQVVRVNRRAAIAGGNLAALCPQADSALQSHDWLQAIDRSNELDAEAGATHLGLTAPQWRRLAVLASFVSPMAHATAARLPLVVLPPAGLRVLNPVQALQVMLTLLFLHAGYARRLVSLASLMPNAEVRQAFHVFMHTLLARRLSFGSVVDRQSLRHALEDAWCDVLVQRRWERLASRFTPQDCERILRLADQRGWSTPGVRWIADESAKEGWGLDGIPVRVAPCCGTTAPASQRPDQAAMALAGGVSARSEPWPMGRPLVQARTPN